jgi:hypothetical protein
MNTLNAPAQERVSLLLEQLADDLGEVLPRDVVRMLTAYRALTELWVESEQPDDRDALRYASSHLALQALGVTDAAVERIKAALRVGRDELPTLDAVN